MSCKVEQDTRQNVTCWGSKITGSGVKGVIFEQKRRFKNIRDREVPQLWINSDEHYDKTKTEPRKLLKHSQQTVGKESMNASQQKKNDLFFAKLQISYFKEKIGALQAFEFRKK